MTKTKCVHGVDCPRHSFAYAPDDNPTNWLLPIWIPGDAKKTLNAVKSSLYRFNEAKVSAADKQRVFDTIRGAALCHGIDVEQRTFTAFAPQNDAPAPEAEQATAPEVKPAETALVVDPELQELLAIADRKADAFLRSLGLE